MAANKVSTKPQTANGSMTGSRGRGHSGLKAGKNPVVVPMMGKGKKGKYTLPAAGAGAAPGGQLFKESGNG